MGELHKIVVDSFPLDSLPEALRQGIASGKLVRVTVEYDAAAPRRRFRDFIGSAPGRYENPEAVVDEIRELRADWDDKDRSRSG